MSNLKNHALFSAALPLLGSGFALAVLIVVGLLSLAGAMIHMMMA